MESGQGSGSAHDGYCVLPHKHTLREKNPDDHTPTAPPEVALSIDMSAESRVCPALHLRRGETADLTVCGKRNDRLILTADRIRKWCAADYLSCPNRQGAYDQ